MPWLLVLILKFKRYDPARLNNVIVCVECFESLKAQIKKV